MTFNMWNDYRLKDVVCADCFFYPEKGTYSGNLYNENGVVIGDFTANNSVIIELHFPGIFER